MISWGLKTSALKLQWRANDANGVLRQKSRARGQLNLFYFAVLRQQLLQFRQPLLGTWKVQSSDGIFRGWQGRSQGGPGVPLTPPFASLFEPNNLQHPKHVTLSRNTAWRSTWQSGEYPHFDTVWAPLWKIVATLLNWVQYLIHTNVVFSRQLESFLIGKWQ